MPLTADTRRDYEASPLEASSLPLLASTVTYEGSFLGDNAAGFARALVAGDPFRGIATQGVTGNATNGGVEVPAIRKGVLCNVAVTGGSLAGAGSGALVYASADDTLTTTSTSNSLVGRLIRWDATNSLGDVSFEAVGSRSPA